jgi:hypothetical protein
MGKTYKVVFNSQIADGASNATQRFFYNWSKLEEGKYKGSFTFTAGIRNNLNFANVPLIGIDLGQQSNVFYARGINALNTPTSILSTYMGCLTHTQIEYNILDPVFNNGYLTATLETNPPFYLQTRPLNNFITVVIRQNATPGGFVNTNIIGNYTLTLYLEKLD